MLIKQAKCIQRNTKRLHILLCKSLKKKACGDSEVFSRQQIFTVLEFNLRIFRTNFLIIII